MSEERTYRTKSGRVLTDADIEALAEEAERGYDVNHLTQRRMSTPERFLRSALFPLLVLSIAVYVASQLLK